MLLFVDVKRNVSEIVAPNACFVVAREVAIHKCQCCRYWAFCLMKYIIISMLLAVTFI